MAQGGAIKQIQRSKNKQQKNEKKKGNKWRRRTWGSGAILPRPTVDASADVTSIVVWAVPAILARGHGTRGSYQTAERSLSHQPAQERKEKKERKKERKKKRLTGSDSAIHTSPAINTGTVVGRAIDGAVSAIETGIRRTGRSCPKKEEEEKSWERRVCKRRRKKKVKPWVTDTMKARRITKMASCGAHARAVEDDDADGLAIVKERRWRIGPA